MNKKKKKWQVVYWSDKFDQQVIEGFDTHEEAVTRQYELECKNGRSVTLRLRPKKRS